RSLLRRPVFPGRTRARLEVVECRLRDEQRARPDDRGDLELAGADDRDAVEVPERLDEALLVVARDEHDRMLLAPRSDEGRRILGGGRLPGGAVDERERAFVRMCGER